MSIFKKDNLAGIVVDLIEENNYLKKRNKELVDLCEEKDAFFTEMISDGLRHGSKMGAKHMADRREYLKSKK